MRSIGFRILVFLAVLALSCAPASQTVETAKPQPVEWPAPSDLVAIAGDGEITLQWRTNHPSNAVVSGYNIYLAKDGTGYEPVSTSPYPGDLEADTLVESYSARELQNGDEYLMYVSTVYPNGKEVFSADTASAIPRPEGRFRLTERISGPESGFSLSGRKSTITDGLDNDLYLAVIRGKLTLASPHRIDDVLRHSKFSSAREVEESGQKSYLPADKKTGAETIALTRGMLVIVETEDHHFALLQIDSVDEKAKVVEISYVYQTRPNLMSF